MEEIDNDGLKKEESSEKKEREMYIVTSKNEKTPISKTIFIDEKRCKKDNFLDVIESELNYNFSPGEWKIFQDNIKMDDNCILIEEAWKDPVKKEKILVIFELLTNKTNALLIFYAFKRLVSNDVQNEADSKNKKNRNPIKIKEYLFKDVRTKLIRLLNSKGEGKERNIKLEVTNQTTVTAILKELCTEQVIIRNENKRGSGISHTIVETVKNEKGELVEKAFDSESPYDYNEAGVKKYFKIGVEDVEHIVTAYLFPYFKDIDDNCEWIRRLKKLKSSRHVFIPPTLAAKEFCLITKYIPPLINYLTRVYLDNKSSEN